MKKRFKFLEEGLKSAHKSHTWEIGKEYKVEGKLEICNNGYHCSKEIYQAFSYIQGTYLAEVSVSGDSVINDDKECWEKMKILKVWKWQKKDSVAVSIGAAEMCLKNFEKVFPNDKRPREAIEAARKWLENPTKKNESALSAESAARSAWSAAEAAGSARSAESAASAWSALSAESAAEAAASAAEAAAASVESAASAEAWSAVRSAAWSAAEAVESVWSEWSAKAKITTLKKIYALFDKQLNKLEIYDPKS